MLLFDKIICYSILVCVFIAIFFYLFLFLPFSSMIISAQWGQAKQRHTQRERERHPTKPPTGKKVEPHIVVCLFETKYRFVFICCRIRYMDTDGGMLSIFEWQRGEGGAERRAKTIKKTNKVVSRIENAKKSNVCAVHGWGRSVICNFLWIHLRKWFILRCPMNVSAHSICIFNASTQALSSQHSDLECLW